MRHAIQMYCWFGGGWRFYVRFFRSFLTCFDFGQRRFYCQHFFVFRWFSLDKLLTDIYLLITMNWEHLFVEWRGHWMVHCAKDTIIRMTFLFVFSCKWWKQQHARTVSSWHRANRSIETSTSHNVSILNDRMTQHKNNKLSKTKTKTKTYTIRHTRTRTYRLSIFVASRHTIMKFGICFLLSIANAKNNHSPYTHAHNEWLGRH